MRYGWRGMGWMLLLVGWAQAVGATSVPGREGPVPWIIESAEYTGTVAGQVLRVEARFDIRVLRDGWTEIPLALPGSTVTAVTVKKKSGETHIMPRNGFYAVTATKKGTCDIRVTFSVPLIQDSQFEGLGLGIPQATFSTLSLFVARKDVELRPQDELYVERELDASRGGVKLVARLGAAERIDLRWRTRPAAPVTVEPVLYGEVHSSVTIEEQLAQLMAVIDYRVTQGDVKELQVEVPSGINLLNVRGAGIDDWHLTEAKDHKVLSVNLGNALKDTTYRLILEGEQTIEAGSTVYVLPGLRLVGVKQERGYLAVAQAGSIELSPDTLEGINRVDVKELPDLLRTGIGSPATLAFKYHQHPYHIALTLTRHQDHPVLAAIAERGELVTVLSRHGELLTRATYLIQANKKQFLEVLLPEGAALWSCLVGNKSVKPVKGTGNALMVPLAAASDAAQAVVVELVYFERRPELVRIGQLKLQGPVLDVPTTVANWSLYTPQEIKFLRMSGNIDRGMVPAEFLEESLGQTVVASGGMSERFNGAPKPSSLAHRRGSYGLLSKLGEAGRSQASADAVGEQFEPQYARSLDEDGKKDGSFTSHSQPEGLPQMRLGPSQPKTEDRLAEVVDSLNSRLQETGILPLKIRLPKTGNVYYFSRLMTTQEALRLEATFVHLQMPWLPFAALGLLMVPVGGFMLSRFPRI